MTDAVTFGPRLAAHPTGALRSALLVKPGKSIESARPLPGEPNAFYTRAIAQQEILAKTLRQFGCATTLLEPHSEDPYAASAVDSAIVFENGVVMMRPSAMTRRSETAKLEAEFERIDVPIAGHITPPGLLDGSDVLMAGTTAFVGVSQRSNALGRSGFAAIAK